MKHMGSVFAASLASALITISPFAASAATLYSQPDHSQLVYSAPASLPNDTYWATVKFTVAETARPQYWWLNATLPNHDTALTFFAPGQPPSCTLRFEQQLVPGWVRAYALPDCVTGGTTRADLPVYAAGSMLQLLWLGSLGDGGALYGGGASAPTPYCYNELTGGDSCTAPPALFVTDDPHATPEAGMTAPYPDTATHLTGTYYGGYTFTLAGSPYVIDGPVYIRSGAVTLEPGVVVKFRNSVSSLTAHADAPFVSQGTAENPVYFTSYKDDAHGGDTNGDGGATTPAPGDWGYLSIGCGSVANGNRTDYIRLSYGGAQTTAGDESAALRVCFSTYGFATGDIRVERVEASHNLGGMLLMSNTPSATVTGSSIHDNVLYGAKVQYSTPAVVMHNLAGNWWGSSTGPSGLVSNPGGTGDRIDMTTAGLSSAAVTPWLTEDPFAVPSPVAAAPTVANLQQFREFGIDPIAPGAGFIGNAVVLKAEVNDADSTQVTLEVELKRVDTPFDGTNLHATTTAIATGATSTIALPIDTLISLDDQYGGNNHQTFHWRARSVDAEGHTGEWQEFTPNAPSFTANVVPLWTQVQSSYPSLASTTAWAGKQYASTSCSISACGCGIASITMIARYYGINVDLDGEAVDLDNANTWLKNNDGYAPGGLIRWNVIEKYLGIRQSDGIYRRLALSGFRISPTLADARLSDLKPVIARKEAAGHFFVVSSRIAKGSENTYLVHDPGWYNTRTLNDTRASFVRPYGNSYDYAIVYSKLDTPTKISFAANADLYLASPAELLVIDSQGRRVGLNPTTGTTYNEIPDALYYKEGSYESLEVDVDPSTQHYIKVLHLPALSDGTYNIKVIGTGNGSYTFTTIMTSDTGSTATRVFTASTAPSQVTDYQLVVSDGISTISHDTIPPEASVSFSTTTKNITITGVDDQSAPTVVTGATSSTITDASGNTLTLNIGQSVKQSSYAALVIPSFFYSTGTTTAATSSARYFWSTDKSGKYTLFISAVRTPTGRQIAIYTSLLGKTYIVSSTVADDTANLSLQSALLLLRSKTKTYTGLYILGIETQQGSVLVK